jgi:hypothetical protein
LLPLNRYGRITYPGWAGDSWEKLKRELLDGNEDWYVWINWYENRLNGKVPNQALELARATIPDDAWAHGPKIVNARIKQLIGENAVTKFDLEREENCAVSDPPEAKRPASPLPTPSPATRFAYFNGQFDVVPPTAWQSAGNQAIIYHGRARQLAIALADRLTKTDAVPDVAGSVGALIDILGYSVDQVQPDQLRLASRSISARARVYGHPAAHWEISAESVSALFELADVLADLQAFARSELEAHENAIRQLDLTPETAAEAKTALDLVTEGILASPEIMSERVELAFESAATISDTTVDGQVKISVEGDRTLQVANLALVVARELAKEGETPVQLGDGLPPSRLPPEEPPLYPWPDAYPPFEREPEKRKRQPRRARATRRRSATGEFPLEDFGRRIVARVNEKGPDKIGDAIIEAATSIIKHAPKSVPGIGALLALALAGHPLFVAGGAFATTAAWIGYELRRRNQSKK